LTQELFRIFSSDIEEWELESGWFGICQSAKVNPPHFQKQFKITVTQNLVSPSEAINSKLLSGN